MRPIARRFILLNRSLLIAVLPLVVAVPRAASAQDGPSHIVVFGASLSDSGNAFALRGGSNTAPDYSVDPLLVPGRPYSRGGHHFSNGATWIEQWALAQGLEWSVRPAFQSSAAGATNYAVGGARAYDDGINLNLSMQVATFLEESGGVAPSTALYTIEMGGNDIRDALVVFSGGGNGGPVIQAALTSIAGEVLALYEAGARHFLIWSAPNVGLTPAIRGLDAVLPGAAQLATGLTLAYNQGLENVLGQLSGLPDIRIDRLDAYRLLNDIVGNPSGFGLTNATTACITPNVAPFFCQAPDTFLFWDGIHPTHAAHALIAAEAAFVLSQW
jgi:phospholipase/lecithinase/hemolysin